MAIQELLSELGRKLRKDRPLVPASCGYRIVVADPVRRCAHIWLRTRGCKHDVLHGGCTVCNYWVSTPPSNDEMVTSMEAALASLPFEPATIVLSASGSFLDSWEIEPEARRRILEVLRKLCPDSHVILETHPDTVATDNIADCSNILGPDWTIEMGLESATPHILRCCLNKPLLPKEFSRTLGIIQKTSSVSTIANVVLGIPFLTSDEIVDNAVATVTWAFEQGVDECVLFPLNLKPYTLAHWMAEHSLYNQPNLWMLVDILAMLPEEMLERTSFAWHRVDRGQASIWDQGIVPPKSCNSCYQHLMAGLDTYLANSNRMSILQSLKSNVCSCYVKWQEKNQDTRPLTERLFQGYRIAAINTFGIEYWNTSSNAVQQELDELLQLDALYH